MRLAVLVACHLDAYSSTWLSAFCNELCACLRRSFGDKSHVVVGARSPKLRRFLERSIKAEAASVRECRWDAFPTHIARRMYPRLGYDFDHLDEVWLPIDNGWNFADADVWMTLFDLNSSPMLYLRPTILYGRGVSERYVGPGDRNADRSVSGERTLSTSLRQARRLIASHERTIADYISRSGFPPERCTTVPLLPTSVGDDVGQQPQCLASFLASGFQSVDEEVYRGVALHARRNAGFTLRTIIDCCADGELTMREADRERARHRWAAEKAGLGSERFDVRFIFDPADVPGAFAGSRMVIAGSPVAGEPVELLAAARAGLPYLGRRTPQAGSAAGRVGHPVHLFAADDQDGIAAALASLNATGDVACPPAMVDRQRTEWAAAFADVLSRSAAAYDAA